MVQSLVLTGPTAVGKTALALEVAERGGFEIINADSVCFYRHFDIGSAKPARAELEAVPHHLIDVADPLENYHAATFFRDCLSKIGEIRARGNRPLIVGGSGFYLKVLRFGLWDAPATSEEFRKSLEPVETPALFERLHTADPGHAAKVGPADRYRIIRALEIHSISGKKPSELERNMRREPDPAFKLVVLDREKDELERRMRDRIGAMIRNGWIEEVESLLKRFPESRVLGAAGYAQIVSWLKGSPPKGRKMKPGQEGLVEEILLAHRRLAKQQRTWFKSQRPEAEFLLDRDTALVKEKIMEPDQ
jgi:tRNA dimethylallyltransferase